MQMSETPLWRHAHTTHADLSSIGLWVKSRLHEAFGARWPSPRPAAGGVASCG